MILRGANDWHMAVPELRSYPTVVPLRNHRNSALSPGNCGDEGFRRDTSCGRRRRVSAVAVPGAPEPTRSRRVPNTLSAPAIDLVRASTEAGSMTGKAALRRGGSRGERYVEFWTQLLERVQREHPDWPSDRPHPKNDVDMRSPSRAPSSVVALPRMTDFVTSSTSARATQDGIWRSSTISGSGRSNSRAANRGPLQWEDLPNKSACRIADYKHGCTIEQRERFDEDVEWFIDAGKPLRAALIDVWSRP